MLDAIEMAGDAMGLGRIDYEDDGKEMPKASNYEAVFQKVKGDTQIFDYTQGILTMVEVDFAEYRRKHDYGRTEKS